MDLARLGQAGGLEAALAAPAAQVELALGAHLRQDSAHFTLQTATTDGRKDELDETWRTEVDDAGAIHAIHDNSHDYGREWYAVSGKLYVRLRHGKLVRRDPQGEEVERLRDEQAGALAGYLAVLGRFAAREVQPATVLGRPARRVKLTLAPAAAALTDEDPAHAWRRGVRVSALDGAATLDDASGALVEARLDATYTLRRGDKEIAVTLAYRSNTTLGHVARVAAPTENLADLERARPLLDRAALLEGLLPGRE